MSEENKEDRIFMQEYLNGNEYAKLLENPVYIEELNAFCVKNMAIYIHVHIVLQKL